MSKTLTSVIPHCGARQTLLDHYRCMDTDTDFQVAGNLSEQSGYFRFGGDVLFGRCTGAEPASRMTEFLPDRTGSAAISGSTVTLPFDAEQVIGNLRLERYAQAASPGRSLPATSAYRKLYYLLRPALPVAVRKHFQKLYLRDWNRLPFPQWPVDSTVENVLERLLVELMRSQGLTRIPFIWFWPDGAKSCSVMTHDVETEAGRDFCDQLMDLNDSFDIKSSFQVVPEERYAVSRQYLNRIKSRGFEVNVQDLNHDGLLYSDREVFLRRAQQINRYGRDFGAEGFRSGILYRNPDWYGALDFAYDMSIPNVAHLDPQRGGCCTVFPYFINDMVELPVTTTQDYSLFHIFQDYSIDLWRKQIAMIRRKNGLISFIAHPDYLIEEAPRQVYRELLAHISALRAAHETWIALPGEVARWWKVRSQLQLAQVGRDWRIEGYGRERARLAYAILDGDSVTYACA